MRADAECLILEDDPTKLEELKVAALSNGLYPICARSPADALRMLKQAEELSRPVLAIIDRDMTMAPDQTYSSIDVLRYLAAHFQECTVLVYSANIDSLEAQMEIWRAHPRPLFHSKRTGDDELFARVRVLLNKKERVLDKTTGKMSELVIEHAAVRHLSFGQCAACEKGPGADRHGHWVAVTLLMKCPAAVFLKNETMTRAARRFGDWLREHNIEGEVQAVGKRKYCLKLPKVEIEAP